MPIDPIRNIRDITVAHGIEIEVGVDSLNNYKIVDIEHDYDNIIDITVIIQNSEFIKQL